MLAKIMHKNGVYYSPVFAVSTSYPNSKVVVFDPSFSYLTVVSLFREVTYTTLLVNYNTNNFAINEENFKSYWNDKNIFKTVKRKKYTPEMLTDAKEILKQSTYQEFTKIQSPSDLEALSINSGAFHDGYILGMCEKDGSLEILFDTSWGSFIILRCRNILENTLRIGDVFYHCDMQYADGYVELSFSQMCYENPTVIKALDVEFKPLFGKKLKLSEFDCSILNECLTIQNKQQQIHINTANHAVLDFQERNVLGYLENDDVLHRFIIFDGDLVYTFSEYHTATQRKRDQKNVEIVLKFQNECKKHGFCFDSYPASDDDICGYEENFGELIHSHKYSSIYGLLNIFSIYVPIFLIHNLMCLLIQIFNPEMRWVFFLIFGLGISLSLFLLCLAIYFIKKTRKKASDDEFPKRLEIYENGLKYFGYNTSFLTDYESIINVEHKKRIIVSFAYSKFKLHKSKHDKELYELIQEQRAKKTSVEH